MHKKKEKRIVFVNIDGTPLTDEFEFDFGTKQQVDAQNPTSIRKLIKDISLWLKNGMKSCEEKSQKNKLVDTTQKSIIIDSNALCPCGSGRKFKDCHGKNVSFK